jgi:putative nucleotidyltransferase with HDIG domain
MTDRRLLPPAVDLLLPALAGSRVWAVGGSVRDAILGRLSQDVDLVVDGDAVALGRRLANEAGADYFELDPDRGTGRMLLTTARGVRTIYDFTRLQGGSIDSDLRLRDFTVNAMAVAVDDPGRLIDPTGGLEHLRRRWLEACTPRAVLDDPIRAVRAVRVAAELEARISPETVAQIREAARLLGEVSAERLRDELFRLLGLPSPAPSLRLMDHLGLLTAVLPELEPLRGLGQPPSHAFDALTHTLATVEGLERILKVLLAPEGQERSADLASGLAVHRLGRFRQSLGEYLSLQVSFGRTRRQALFLAALLHDVGKPRTRAMDSDGTVRFLGHERVGAAIAVDACRRLSLSLAETAEIETIVAEHQRPGWLEKTPPLSRRAVYRYFRSTLSTGVAVALLSLADLLAKHVPPVPQEAWASRLDIVRELLEAWFEGRSEKIEPDLLFNGTDVMQLVGVPPGPTVGLLLEDLREAQASGEVGSQAEARAFVLSRYEQHRAAEAAGTGDAPG